MLDGEVLAMPISPILIEEVFCASRYLAVNDAIHASEVVIHTNVNNPKMESVLSAEHIDTSAPTGKVDHLLPGDLPWRHADPLAFNAVIAT